MKKFLILSILYSFIYSQTEDDGIQIQENSVFWKKGVDKLVLKDGDLFYGDYLEMKEKKVFFKIEFQDHPSTFEISNIKHLVLANGRIVIRNNKDISLPCFSIALFSIFYFSKFHSLIR